MNFDLGLFLLQKGFKKSDFSNLINYEIEKENEKNEVDYFCITVNTEKSLLNAGSSIIKGTFFALNRELPKTEAEAETFLTSFLSTS